MTRFDRLTSALAPSGVAFRWPAPLALLLAILPPAPAIAELPLLVPIGGEFAVNSFVAGRQDRPQVAMAENGVFVAVWTSGGEDGSGNGVYSRKFPVGGPPFTASALHAFVAGDQARAVIDANEDGDWVAIWDSQDEASATSDGDVVARQTSFSGTLLASPFLAETTSAGNAFAIAAARSDDGTSIVLFTRAFVPLLRKFDASGSPLTAEIALDPAFDSSFSVAAGPTGSFVAAGAGSDGSGDGVFFQLYDAAGTALGDPIQANADSAGSQINGGVGIAKDGTIVVVWHDSGEQRVEVRLFRSDGAPASGDLVVSDLATANLSHPRLDVAPDGGFAVAWSDGELFARELDRTGRPASEIAPVNTTTPFVQRNHDVASGAGRFVVVWESEFQDGDSFGVFGQLFERRSIFADGFESADKLAWSSTVP